MDGRTLELAHHHSDTIITDVSYSGIKVALIEKNSSSTELVDQMIMCWYLFCVLLNLQHTIMLI